MAVPHNAQISQQNKAKFHHSLMKDEKIVLVEILSLISHTYSFILMKYVFKKSSFCELDLSKDGKSFQVTC